MSRVQANRRETEPPVRGNPLDGLHGFLAEYPTLGLEHPLGRAIHEQVKQTRPVTLGPSVWFRGLACSASSAPRADDFLPPDPRRIAEMRSLPVQHGTENETSHYGCRWR